MKPFNHRNWLRSAFVLLTCVWSAPGVSADDVEPPPTPPPVDARVVSVGIYDNPPKLFLDDDKVPKGFFPELLGAIAARQGWRLDYRPCTWSQCLAGVENGDLDLMMDVAFSPERAERFDFNREVVLSNWSAVYVPWYSPISSILDLDQRRVAVVEGGIQVDKLRDQARAFDIHPRIVEVNNYAAVLEYVRDGKVAAGVVNRLYGIGMADRLGLHRTDIVFGSSPLHFVAPKAGVVAPKAGVVAPKAGDGAVLATIDRYLADWKGESGSPFQQALETWIVTEDETKLPPRARWAVSALIVFALLSLAFIGVLKWQVQRKTAVLRQSNETLATLMAVNDALISARDERAFLQSACQSIVGTEEFFTVSVWTIGDPVALTPEHVVAFDGNGSVMTGVLEWRNCLLKRDLVKQVFDAPSPPTVVDFSAKTLPECVKTIRTPVGAGAALMLFPLASGEPRVLMCLGTTAAYWKNWRAEELLRQLVDDLAFGIQHIRDTEEQRETSRRLHQTEKMNALGDLAGGIAHDLKNMLFPIITLTQMTLKDLSQGSAAHKRLEKVIEAAERAKTLTEKIHGFSHVDESERTLVPVTEFLEESLVFLRSAIPANVDLHTDFADLAATVCIEVDPAQLQTMVLNLASNAADAIGERNGRISLSVAKTYLRSSDDMAIPVARPGTYVKLAFSDNGDGMDQATARKIFEPYFTTKLRGKGTGLGMVMVAKFVVNHNGGIALKTAPGQGTTFEIYLPHRDAAGTEPGTAE